MFVTYSEGSRSNNPNRNTCWVAQWFELEPNGYGNTHSTTQTPQQNSHDPDHDGCFYSAFFIACQKNSFRIIVLSRATQMRSGQDTWW